MASDMSLEYSNASSSIPCSSTYQGDTSIIWPAHSAAQSVLYSAQQSIQEYDLTAWSMWQGSGKTLAFGLPILQRLTAQKEAAAAKGPAKLRALILTPTRELALQVGHSGAPASFSIAAPVQLFSINLRLLALLPTPTLALLILCGLHRCCHGGRVFHSARQPITKV